MVAPSMSALTRAGAATMRHWPSVTAFVLGSTGWQAAGVALASGIDRTTSSTATSGGLRSRWVGAALAGGGGAGGVTSSAAGSGALVGLVELPVEAPAVPSGSSVSPGAVFAASSTDVSSLTRQIILVLAPLWSHPGYGVSHPCLMHTEYAYS